YPLYAYTVHKTFADLFLSSAWDADKKQLRFTRRARGEEEADVSMLLSAKGLTDVTAVTDAGALLRVGYTKADILRLGDETAVGDDRKARRGSAAVPIAYLRGNAHGKTVLHLTVGRRAAGTQDTNLLADIRWEHRMLCGGITPMDTYVSVMLGALFRHTDTRLLSADEIRKRQPDGRYAVGRERYWQFGLSGDLPIFAVTVDEADGKEARYRLRAVLHAWKYLLIAGVRSDLVIAVSETDAYENPVQGTVRQQIRDCGLEFFIGHGLYLLRHEEAEKNGILICASHVFDSDGHPVGEDAHAVRQTESEPVRVFEVQHGPGVTAYRMTDNHVLIEKGIQPAPWTYLLTNGVMGTQLTLNTLGFSFFTNARECRVTPWYGEALSERSGEVLYLHIDGEDAFYDLCRSAHIVMLTPHEVHYLGHAGILSFRVSVSIPDRRKRKRIRIFLKNDSDTAVNGTLRYQIRPLFGALPGDREAVMWEWQENASGDGGAVVFSSLTNAACAPYHAKMYLTGVRNQTGSAADDRVYTEGQFSVQAHEGRAADAILQVIRRGEREISDETALPPYRLDLKPVLNTGLQYLDPLANTWLPLQIVHVRMFGRCGYDQPGGAYGFRDQLQDAMAAGMIDASLLRTQICRAAAHQYVEGDVQHWWHPEPIADPAKSHRGIRSRCSDDYLWLPLAAARYIALTGDAKLLDTDIRYLESPPLADGENERYETPLRSAFRENLYMHCIRAIEHGLRFGVHGLPLIGIGDWNDGMNRVGAGGAGESVWGGMFLMLVLHTFLPICRSRGDNDGAAQYEEIIRKLAFAIESEAWNGQWYRRAWYDDGTPIGNPGDPCAEIDLLVQSFAAIVNRRVRLSSGAKPFDEKRVHLAMLAAYERLYDAEHEVFALLSPPFYRDTIDHHNDTAAHKPHDPG
ncbi:MAG: GH36-type glycosyl hydrolase domain-containing protein, partial [Eubacteriales bacterium]